MTMKRTIAAAALAAGLFVHTHGFAQVAITDVEADAATIVTKVADPEAGAKKYWREGIAKIPVSGRGCFHASYPNFVWKNMVCTEGQPGAHSVPVSNLGHAPGSVGNGHDYIAQAQGLITTAVGQFELSGVTSEKGVGGIAGTNEYMIQINSNNDKPYSLCTNRIGCTVWQQFFYATDYDNNNTQSAVFIQYWLLNYDGNCPAGWWPSTGYQVSCYKNSAHAQVPHLPITELGNISFTASATAGGDDVVQLTHDSDAYIVTADDNVLDIGSGWYQAEFNVFGDTDSAKAVFNAGASIQVILQLADGSTVPPSCIEGIGTTGETNNLNFGPCQAFVFIGPAITFTESLPKLFISPIPVGPPLRALEPNAQSTSSTPVRSATTVGSLSN
jgi:hypothetical protein